jgi:broad specificity phosphatase PhoE
MSMPEDLLIVRHGKSEGNLVNEHSRQGDNALLTPEHINRHESEWHLVEEGVCQARAAGELIRREFSGLLDFHLVSEYVRALETAAHLGLRDARWYVEPYLRERGFGDMEGLSHAEKAEQHGERLRRRDRNPYWWRAINGESLDDLALKWDRVQQILHRKYSMQRGVVVAHEGVLWVARLRIERLTVTELNRLLTSTDPKDRFHNGHVLHYTRRNPETGQLSAHLDWVRSICPWDMSRSTNEWRKIERRTFTSEELLEMAARVPRVHAY